MPGMGEAPPPPCRAAPVQRRAAAARFRLPRQGRRKVLVVRLGGGARAPAGGRRGLCLRRLKLRWLRRAVWQLAAFCVAALSGPRGAPDAPPPWTGVDPYFAAPFVPAVLLLRPGQDHSTTTTAS